MPRDPSPGRPPDVIEQWCWYEVSVSPICAGFTCKFGCWFFAKINKAKVQSHKCLGKGYKIK
uniref:Uncharacterized protein n=1 Tax=Oryza meridionalis TaxID=40149 RepID=A0A0E0EJL0_9ORYZ